jgi:hypothetical protein
MADPVNVMDPAAVEAANTAARSAMENQGRDGLKSNVEDTTHTLDALDALAKQAAEAANKPTIDEDVDPAPDPAAAKPDSDPAPDPAAAKPDATPPAQPDPTATKLADDMFKGISLAPNASPKSAESFTKIKMIAAQEVAARDAKVVELQKAVETLKEQLKNPIPPETEAELKEHREWRAKLDVEADPKFNEYTKGIASAQEFVYAQLKKGGVSDELIEKIKSYKGPENVNLTTLFEKGGPNGSPLDATTRRLVESKIADIEQMKFNREQAIKSAKENIGAYLKAQEAARSKDLTVHDDATRAELNSLMPQITWLQPVKVEGDDAAKKAAQENNAFLETVKKEMEVALNDGTAGMRATMILGMGRLFVVQRELKAAQDKLAASEKSLTEANAKLAKYMNASRSKLPQSGASATNVPAPAPKTDYNKSAAESLDELAKQITEERQRAANRPSA